MLQQQNRTEAEARGLLEAQLERVEAETSALGINLQEAKKAYSIQASQLVDALKQETETLHQQRLQDGDFSETLKRKTTKRATCSNCRFGEGAHCSALNISHSSFFSCIVSKPSRLLKKKKKN